jgi:hypothetical protein
VTIGSAGIADRNPYPEPGARVADDKLEPDAWNLEIGSSGTVEPENRNSRAPHVELE